MKRKIKIASLATFGVSVLFLAASFFVQDIPVSPVYTYTDNRIAAHSWHDFYKVITAVLVLMLILSSVTEVIILIAEKIGNKEKILGSVIWVSAAFICGYGALMFGNWLVTGWSADRSPQCYEFTDDRHRIVIEEKSFLLDGGGTIYQIKDDNEAVVIGEFTTDDGGRNDGDYEIKWSENSAEITYHTFGLENRKAVVNVTFE